MNADAGGPLHLLAPAESDLAEAWARDAARLGEDHPDALAAALVYAAALDGLDRWAESAALYRRVLACQERRAGCDGQTVAATLGRLARACWQLGELAEAEALYRRALAATETWARGPAPVDAALAANNLGALLHAQGRTREALPLLKRALRDLRRQLGDAHPHTQAARENLQEARKFGS
jgi:tetratricopeptide (TPR) repeat protein